MSPVVCENFRFDRAKFKLFRTQVHMEVYPREEAKMHVFSINTDCPHLDEQVSMYMVCCLKNSKMPTGSSVVNSFKSFNIVKTPRLNDGLVLDLSRCLRPRPRGHGLLVASEVSQFQTPSVVSHLMDIHIYAHALCRVVYQHRVCYNTPEWHKKYHTK